MNAVRPVYGVEQQTSTISLSKEKVRLYLDDSTVEGDGEILVRLIPHPRLEVRAEYRHIAFSLALGKMEKCEIVDRRLEVPGFATKVNMKTSGTSEEMTSNLTWCVSREPIVSKGDDTTKLKAVVFHLVNFPNFHGARSSTLKEENRSYRINHIDLLGKEWKITLNSLCSTSSTCKKLKESGGYDITHAGRIERNDGNTFAGEDAKRILKILLFFFSFARGMWATPILPVGFDEAGSIVWEEWNSPRGEPWADVLSWFDHQHAKQLEDAFSGFFSIWEDDTWQPAIEEAIYWYLNSNYSSRGIDAGMILSQTAIELLAYTYAVETKKLVTSRGFRQLWASDKFRLLFSSLDLPLGIPSELKKLTELAKSLNWIDAPQALTEMRNELIHPEPKEKGRFNEARFEAWNLGLWYIEMVLLRLCGYEGTYGNRLNRGRWVGQVESVPWCESL